MTLVDDGAAAAQRAVDGHLGDWLDRGLHSALDLVEAQQAALPAPTATGGADTDVAFERAMLGQATAGLDAIAGMRPDVLLLGKDLSQRVLGLVAVGAHDSARSVAGASTLTFQQRRALKAQATDLEAAKTAARVAATERMIAKAEEIGGSALKAALPFLVASLVAL